ncbi:hypothetical protein [Winogradskyella poriferorum]|uniref:hypothetical protein n=1 Tax=Winogradskyella poriferorum TaxID=307627 RepID=UPI003D64A14B
MFFPITIITFYVIHDKKELNVKLFKLYEIFFLLNASLIVISFLFDIDVLKSYPNPRRPGYSGLFNRPNQLSYITIVMIAIYYYKASFLKLKYDYYKLIFLIVVALLGGTKRIYFFLIILLIYHVCNNLRTIYRQVLLVFIALLTLTYFLWDKLYLFIENKLELFVQIYNERGFLSALLSYRNDRLSATWNDQILVDWNILNVFVGGCDFTIERPEMDLIDIFFYFGLIGLVVYMLFFKTTLNAIKLKNNYLLFFITLIFFISALTSGFLNSTNIPFVFMIGVFYLNNISQKLV